MARKKKQALDGLLSTGRISQSTYDVFSKEIDEAVAEIARQQNALLEKMNGKMHELEEQIKTLEMLYANFEIQHVAGEVDEEVYQREIVVFSTGLDTARHELETVKEAVGQLSGVGVAVEPEVEVKPVEEQVAEPEAKLPEEPVAVVEKQENADVAAEPDQVVVQCIEQSEPVRAEAESEEKQDA
jgi:hypothetical protein